MHKNFQLQEERPDAAGKEHLGFYSKFLNIKLFQMKTSVINIDPEIMSGAPVFRGTRVTIKTLFDYIEHGKTIENFLEDYDWVKREQAIKVLEIARNFVSDIQLLRS